MKDFYHRTITFENKEHELSVSHMRTSNGFESITIDYGKQRQLQFASDSEPFGDPEDAVKELMLLLEKAIENPCNLPKPE